MRRNGWIAAGLLGLVAGGPERIEAPGVPNLFRLAPGLYSGAQPEGDAGFETLQRLGIRTIITVDGARPDVEAARAAGMRYVHLPIGYDGVDREQAVRLVRALQVLPGPVFVHCHHGQHRGPAAAALCAIAADGWDRRRALDWLDAAGTDPIYEGLFATVANFEPPTDAELATVAPEDLPEAAELPALVEAMVAIDGTWDRLKAIRAAEFRTPADQPDLDPPHEAQMLADALTEAARTADHDDREPAIRLGLASAAGQAADLRDALSALVENRSDASRARAEDAFQRVGASCNACHARHRNTVPATAR